MGTHGLMTLFAWRDGGLDRKLVTQCALSRVCGACGRPLTRPIAFLGPDEEVRRNSFHAPPMHPQCAHGCRDLLDPSWAIVHTSGFEYVRPARDDLDRRARFEPNSLLDDSARPFTEVGSRL